MKKSWMLVLLLLFIPLAGQSAPLTYDLVRSDGVVLTSTEVKPSIGDAYWDAASNEWYTVIQLRGNQALAGNAAEASAYFRARNLRYAGGATLLIAVVYLLRRRLRRPSRAPRK